MSHPIYKAVIFDLGGVLVTEIWEPLLDWLVVHHGIAKPALEEFGSSVVWGDEFACKRDHKDETVLYDRLIQRFGLKASPAELVERAGSFVRPIPGMMDLVRDLKGRGLTLGICSNNNEFWYARQRDALDLEKVVEHDRIKLSCWVGVKKPKPEIIREAVKAARADAAACVFVDDRMKNVLSAIDLGLTGVHIPESSAPDRVSRYVRRLLEGLGVLSSGF